MFSLGNDITVAMNKSDAKWVRERSSSFSLEPPSLLGVLETLAGANLLRLLPCFCFHPCLILDSTPSMVLVGWVLLLVSYLYLQHLQIPFLNMPHLSSFKPIFLLYLYPPVPPLRTHLFKVLILLFLPHSSPLPVKSV